ncbi:PepSY domain-containing protein [Roseivivax sediminis]|uniref:Peptidase propeptide and YPEB domain-containing protein n=1 Tax=Roseivivax sediminis TaxID=936889 RepID=A0A1I2DUJ1_9RHOB|nr:PepSY domain-containing protein [Roseivivax sediminis]SFE84137.1 Peptidase propeptide and YPEB domain-containing protein [Roseivivax sediminis]
MRKLILTTTVSAFMALPAWAQETSGDDDAIPQETVDSIMAMLEDMQCEMDPDDIEREDDGYDLDDVICAEGGQFDITLDADLNETGRRAE